MTHTNRGSRDERGPGAEKRSLDREGVDICEHCGDEIEATTAVAVPLPSTTLYLCSGCERWTEGAEHR